MNSNRNSNSYGNNKYIQTEASPQKAIIPNDMSWGDKLKDYQKTKDIVYFNKKDFPKIITRQQIMSSEGKFNPILQKYVDPKRERMIDETSKQKKLDLISSGFDKQLEVESTYNLINLSNKLKKFNYEEPSTKTLPNKNANKDNANKNQFNFEDINKKPYNILSNLSLKEHNFLSPKLRPRDSDSILQNCKEGLSDLDKKDKIMEQERYTRDYNIINNEYKIFNKEKKETEKEIQNLYAMKKMQNRKTYDILNCKYINPVLESEFMKNYENEQKLKLSKTKDKNFIIRNPINHYVYDKEGQKRLDDIEREKKRRFILHDNVENYYHSVGNNIETNKNAMSLSHGNPLDLNYITKRGYNIVTGTNFNTQFNLKNRNEFGNESKSQKKSGQYFDNWEKIKLKSDENNTVTKKAIYKSPYDSSDIDKNYEKFLEKRKISLINNNNSNINRSYGTFSKGSGNDTFKSVSRSSYNVPDYISRTNGESFRKINGMANDMNNRIDNKIKYDKMDKNKFFGFSVLNK